MYLALNGSHDWRVRWFRRVTAIFLGDVLRQTADNLGRDFHPGQHDSGPSRRCLAEHGHQYSAVGA